MKKGFTLIEILIVLILFGVLMIVGTDMFLNVLQNSNLATIQSDVRQNASNILSDVSGNIRASSNVSFNPPPVIISSANGTVTYVQDINNNLLKNGSQINSTSVIVPVFAVNCTGSPQTCTITITVQQKPTATRWDQQATVTLNDTITARSY